MAPYRATISLISVILFLPTCTRARDVFWETGQVYDVTLSPNKAPAAGADVSATPRDTFMFSFQWNVVRRDSLFGTYTASWASGVRVYPSRIEPNRIAGQRTGDNFRLELEPSVDDGSLHLEGQVRARGAFGKWETEALPRAAGTFTLRRRNTP